MVNIGKSNADGSVNVLFCFAAFEGKEVSLAGSFNDWDPASCHMRFQPQTQQYEKKLKLAPGSYEYKFVVDGEWLLDENNPNFSANDFGTLNSVIVVNAE